MGWTGLANGGVALTCFALLFEAVGFSIPFWYAHIYEIQTGGSDQEIGLYINVWYAMSCTPGDSGSCQSETIKPDYDGPSISGLKVSGNTPELVSVSAAGLYGLSRHWQVIQIVTTVGVGFALFAALLIIGARCMGSHVRGVFIFATICLLVSGVIAVGISCYSAYANAEALDFIEHASVTGQTFPWSLLIYGIGGLICFAGVLVLMLVSCRWQQYGEYREDDKDSEFANGAPMSRLGSSRGQGYDNHRYGYDQPRRDYSSYDRDRQRYDGRNAPSYGDRSRYDDQHRQGYDRDYGNSRANRDYREPDYGRSNAYGQSRKDDLYRPYTAY